MKSEVIPSEAESVKSTLADKQETIDAELKARVKIETKAKVEATQPEAGKGAEATQLSNALADSAYRYALHGKGTEAVIRASATSSKKEIKRYLNGNAYIDFEGIRVNIDEYFLPNMTLKLNNLASRLLQYILIGATTFLNRGNVSEIALNLNLLEVADALGGNISNKSNKYKFKKGLADALEVLSRISLRITENLKGKDINVGKAYLISSFVPSKTNKETTEVTLGLEFLKYLSDCHLMAFNSNLLKIEDSTRHQFHTEYNLYCSIAKNHIPNAKNQNTPVKARIISIETALRWAQLPSIKDVKNDDRHFNRRILEPLERILDEEHGMTKKWEWCKAKGEELTDAERESMGSYEVLNNLYIHVLEISEESAFLEAVYPATGRIIEHKEAKARQKQRRIAKAKNSQPAPKKDI